MQRIGEVFASNRQRILPSLVALALVGGVIASVLDTRGAQADVTNGCGYGYGSGGTYGNGSGYGYGYVGGVLTFGYGNTIGTNGASCSTTTTTTSSGATTTTTTVPANAPAPAGLPSTSYGTPVSVTASSTTAVSVSQTSGGANVTLSIPAGALPANTTVSVYPITATSTVTSQVPAGQSYVAAIAVSWEAPDGTSPNATAPITMTISDPSIKKGDTIYVLTSTGPKAVGTATSDGSASVTFTADPVFIVTAASATTTTTTPSSSKFRATRTVGFDVDGRTTTLAILGSGFYAQPRIFSNDRGTRVGVLHDYGNRLIDRITTPANDPTGWHVLTIRLADGMTSKVRYLVKK